MRQLFLLLVLVVIIATIKGQWVVHNQTVVNTTYYGHPGVPGQPGYPIPRVPPPGGFAPQPGFINPQPGHPVYPGYSGNSVFPVRNATGYNTSRKNGNDLMVGQPGPGDIILFKEYFSKPSRWLQIREKNIEYPMYPTTLKNRITAVHAIDMSKTPGGHANILTGGVGYSHVTIRLFSERSRGFSYKIIIFGHNF